MNDTFGDIDKDAEFQMVDSHSFLDIILYKAEAREPTIKRGKLKHDKISTWLKQRVP